jgi:ribosome maturation factor RimP
MKQQVLGPLLEPVVAVLGLEIDGIEIKSAGKRALLRISLDGDGPNGLGPDMDQIAEATRAISAALDESDATGNQPYVLEVGTRGVGRPLSQAKLFRRNQGRLVKLRLRDGEGFTGRITAVADELLSLDVDGVPRQVPLDQVASAIVEIEFNRKDQDDQTGES